jgi:hypothetical protein
MSVKVYVVFGKDRTVAERLGDCCAGGEPLSEATLREQVHEYTFETEEEKQAFLSGLEEGRGWEDYNAFDNTDEAVACVRQAATDYLEPGVWEEDDSEDFEDEEEEERLYEEEVDEAFREEEP